MAVSINNKRRINLLIFYLIFTMILLSACTGNYVKYKVSDEVEKTFKSFQALPDYAYYTDRSGRPSAIIAIHRSYTLSNADLWYQVDLSGGQLKSLVAAMVNHANITRPPYGYYILDPQGKPIGMYFTPLTMGLVLLEENNRVAVGFPENDYGLPGGNSSR